MLRLIKLCTLYCLENQAHTESSFRGCIAGKIQHGAKSMWRKPVSRHHASCSETRVPAAHNRHTQLPYWSYDVSVSLVFKILALSKVNILNACISMICTLHGCKVSLESDLRSLPYTRHVGVRSFVKNVKSLSENQHNS